MSRLRSRLVALAVGLLATAGVFGPAAVPAEADGFCDESEGCSPCESGLIIDGKNTRISFKNC